MDKKIGGSILLGVLILIGVVVMTKFSYGADLIDSSTSNIVVYGDGYGVDTTTKGGLSEIVNLTIIYTGVETGLENITTINITWSGNYTFNGWISIGDVYNGACTSDDEAECSGDGNTTFGNVTIMNNAVGGWNCYNNSDEHLSCVNTTEVSTLGPNNDTVIIRFNASAKDNIEDRNDWYINVTIEDGDLGSGGTQGNLTTLTTYVDGLAPRLSDLNISDGNMTYFNSTFHGNVTTTSGYTTYLDANSPLTVRATFYDLSPNVDEDYKLYYNGSEGMVSETNNWLYGDLSAKATGVNGTLKTPTCTQGTLGSYLNEYSIPVMCTWEIPPRVATDSGGSNTEAVIFGFHINDTYNHETTWNDTSSLGAIDLPFSILTNETLPYVAKVNVTDQYGYSRALLDGTEYLNGDTTIRFEVSGGPRATNLSGSLDVYGYVQLYYNVTGTPDIGVNGTVTNYNDMINVTNGDYNVTLDETVANLKNPDYTSFYSVPLYGAANTSGDTINFVIVVGKGNESIDNLNGNYTMTTRSYSWILDIEAPGGYDGTGITIERVTASPSITQSDSAGVTYKCSASDGLSGVQKYVWTLKKPSGYADPITDTPTDKSSSTITFEGSEINELGDHIVKCVVYDNVDNVNLNGKTADGSEGFTVIAAAAGGGPSADTTGAARISFDVDFTTANEGTVKAQQGRIKSFSFDGVTKHTVTFVTVTETSATLKIESTPVTITLSVGETKDVDVNADGTNDMSVKLNEIKNSVADVTIKKIEEGAAKIVAEEEEARGVEPTVTTPVVGAVAGLTWLWWLIGIIVVVALGYYFFFRKK